METEDLMDIFDFDIHDGFDFDQLPDDSQFPAEISEVMEEARIDNGADTLVLLPETNELVRSPPSSSARPTRRRRLFRPIVQGNNTTGRRGKLRCKRCRARNSKCIFTSVEEPCDFCRDRGLPDCEKILGPKTQLNMSTPSRPLSTYDPSIGEENLYRLQMAFVSERSYHRYQVSQLYPLFVAQFGPHISHHGLRHAILADIFDELWSRCPTGGRGTELERNYHRKSLEHRGLAMKFLSLSMKNSTIGEEDLFVAAILASLAKDDLRWLMWEEPSFYAHASGVVQIMRYLQNTNRTQWAVFWPFIRDILVEIQDEIPSDIFRRKPHARDLRRIFSSVLGKPTALQVASYSSRLQSQTKMWTSVTCWLEDNRRSIQALRYQKGSQSIDLGDHYHPKEFELFLDSAIHRIRDSLPRLQKHLADSPEKLYAYYFVPPSIFTHLSNISCRRYLGSLLTIFRFGRLLVLELCRCGGPLTPSGEMKLLYPNFLMHHELAYEFRCIGRSLYYQFSLVGLELFVSFRALTEIYQTLGDIQRRQNWEWVEAESESELHDIISQFQNELRLVLNLHEEIQNKMQDLKLFQNIFDALPDEEREREEEGE